MNPTRFRLRFSDHELAKVIAESKLPKGIQITGPSQPFIRASHGMDIVVYVNIQISSISLVATLAIFLAKQLVAYLKERKQKDTTINDKQIKPQRREVLRLIKGVLADEKARDAQRAMDNKQQVKNRVVKKPK